MINRVLKHCGLSFESVLVEKKGIVGEAAKGCGSKGICDYWLLMMVRERNAV